ncbi:MAG: RDD family protein [Candidatus Poribacteria bacterium]
MYIAPDMVGLQLGGFWRRGTALGIDALLVLLIMLIGAVAYPTLVILSGNPRIAPAMLRTGDYATYERPLAMEVARLIAHREPDAAPEAVRDAVRAGNHHALDDLMAGAPDIEFDEDGNMWLETPTTVVVSDPRTDDEHSNGAIMRTMVFPVERWPRFLGFAALFLGYFTVWPRLLSGRTPGKALLRLRVVRLDGRSLTLWDAFSRAGGYGASVSMLALGFIEALWDPNRQTVHDRIAGTVVVVGRPWPPIQDGGAAAAGPSDGDATAEDNGTV